MIALLFFGFFALYAFTCAPQLAPYRDAGEMTSLLGTLGVAHPPGYPLYSLIGRMATLIPIGNIALRANYFSAMCAAGAIVFLFFTLRVKMRAVPALVAVALLGFSNPFWDLATVSEMYALGLLWFCALMFVTFRLREPVLFAFLMALALGVRMDLLLLIPVFLVWFWAAGVRREWPWMAVAFAFGASVFLYLMVRSRTDPVIDWANPDTLIGVFNSARRKNYSGTLDLLSLSYRPGENFLANMNLYARHVLANFQWWGIAMVGLGVFYLAQRERRFGLFSLTVFAMTGPLFLYLANMPPNPHSIAIVEASFLIPDLMLAIAAGFGAQWVQDQGRQMLSMTGIILFLPLLGYNGMTGYSRASKRENLYARDYVQNVWRSTPKDAVAVFHKDVQLFSLWQAQLIEKRRTDVSLVADGLSASPWYWQMKRRWPSAVSPEISLKDSNGWSDLKNAVALRPVVFGPDVEFNPRDHLQIVPQGAVFALTSASAPVAIALLPEFCVYRGLYVYGGTPDFFSTDLISDHARAHHQQGFFLMQQHQLETADWFFRRAESLDPTFERATSDRAYLRYLKGDLAGACALYRSAVQKSEHTLQLAADYKSLPDVVARCRSDVANGYTQWGAMTERLGRVDDARQLYTRALNVSENAQAHYNLAVTYWGKDWNQVIAHMRRAVELNPQMNDARMYLAKAQAMAAQKS